MSTLPVIILVILFSILFIFVDINLFLLNFLIIQQMTQLCFIKYVLLTKHIWNLSAVIEGTSSNEGFLK